MDKLIERLTELNNKIDNTYKDLDKSIDERNNIVDLVKERKKLEEVYTSHKELGACCAEALSGLMAGGLDEPVAIKVMLLTFERAIFTR